MDVVGVFFFFLCVCVCVFVLSQVMESDLVFGFVVFLFSWFWFLSFLYRALLRISLNYSPQTSRISVTSESGVSTAPAMTFIPDVGSCGERYHIYVDIDIYICAYIYIYMFIYVCVPVRE